MSTYLRKCIDIAPTAVVTPGPSVANDYRNLRQQPWWPALRSTTSWLRLLADWPSIQRVADQPPGFGDGAASLAALDAQVDAARADGMEIVLVPYRYPRWSNGTDNLPPDRPEYEHRAWDRHARLSQYLDFIAGNRPPQTWKPLEYGLPLDGFRPGQPVGDATSSGCGTGTQARSAHSRSSTSPICRSGRSGPQIETDDWTARWGSEGTTLSITPCGSGHDGHDGRDRAPPSRRSAAARAVDLGQ